MSVLALPTPPCFLWHAAFTLDGWPGPPTPFHMLSSAKLQPPTTLVVTLKLFVSSISLCHSLPAISWQLLRHNGGFVCMQDLKSMRNLFSSSLLLWLHLVVEKHSSQDKQEGKWFLDASCICVVLIYCAALTISLMSQNAVYLMQSPTFSDMLHMHCSVQDDAPWNASRVQQLQEFSPFINSEWKNNLKWFIMHLIYFNDNNWDWVKIIRCPKTLSNDYKFSGKMSICSWFYFAFNQKKRKKN